MFVLRNSKGVTVTDLGAQRALLAGLSNTTAYLSIRFRGIEGTYIYFYFIFFEFFFKN